MVVIRRPQVLPTFELGTFQEMLDDELDALELLLYDLLNSLLLFLCLLSM